MASKVWSERKTTTTLLTRPDTKASVRSYGSSRGGSRQAKSGAVSGGSRNEVQTRQSQRSNIGETTQTYGAVTPWATTHTLWESSRRGDFVQLKNLVEGHARINAINVRGLTALHTAAKTDKDKAADLLLRSKCDWSMRTKAEKTALDIAVEKNNHEVVRQLLRHIDITIPQVERLSRNAARKRQYQMQEVFRRYLARIKAGDSVKYKPPRNEDIEPVELKPPPIVPATNQFGELVVLTAAEEDHQSYQLGDYSNLRTITRKREVAHLRKPVVEWSGAELAFWMTEQPTLELGADEYGTAIRSGPISGYLLASLSRSDMSCLLMKLGLPCEHRRFVVRELGRKMISDKSYDRIRKDGEARDEARRKKVKKRSFVAKGGTDGMDSKAAEDEEQKEAQQQKSQLLYVSRTQFPLSKIIGSVEVDIEKTTLKDLRELLKTSRISSKASLRKYVWYERDGALIDVKDEHNWLAVDLLPVACLREGTKEEEEAAKAKIIAERKEMIRRRKEEREKERERLEAAANR